MSFTGTSDADEGTDSYEPVEVVSRPTPDAEATPAVDSPSGSWFIGPRAIALTWLAAGLLASWINPATTESIQPTLLLTILTNVAAIAWLGTIIAGGFKLRTTAIAGSFTGAVMLTGHFICGIDGHLPMTGGIWLTQLMLVAGATAVSGLAWATRR